jgi:hypothetical protein
MAPPFCKAHVQPSLSLILKHRGSIFCATAMVAVSEKTSEIAVAHTAFRMIDGVVFICSPLGWTFRVALS